MAILGYLVVNAAAARLLDDRYGYFVIVLTTSIVVGQLSLVGAHRGGLREAARLDLDDVEGLRDLRRSARVVTLLTLPAAGVAAAALTFVVLDDGGLHSRLAVSAAMGVLVWLGGQQKLWANYLRGFGQVRFASLLEGRSGGSIVSLGQAVAMVVVLLLVPESGLAGALGALAVGYAVPIALAWHRVSLLWRHVELSGPILRDLVAVVRRHGHFALNLLGGFLNSSVEIWLAGLLLATADVSLYSSAQRLSVLLAVPLISIGVVFSPVVARLFGHDDSRLESLLRTGATAAAIVTAVVWIPLLVFPGPILAAVYGKDFADAAPILTLLTLGSIVNVLTGLCGTALTMSHHERLMTTVQWVAVVCRVTLGVALAARFGALGLGASAAVVTAGFYVTLWVLARRRMGLRTHLTLHPNLQLMRDTSG